jgi:hypothetical protein
MTDDPVIKQHIFSLSSKEVQVLIEALQAARDKSFRYDEMEALLKKLGKLR